MVQVWDMSPQLTKLSMLTADARDAQAAMNVQPQRSAPRHAFTGHADEGYAMDWSPTVDARLATGDNAGGIHVWEPREGGRWAVDKTAVFKGHESSVEDLQWSPAEAQVFASCGADGYVCVWDARNANAAPALRVKTHDTDVNVMSWNRVANCMLATGADDGSLRIWDLRMFNRATPSTWPTFRFTEGP